MRVIKFKVWCRKSKSMSPPIELGNMMRNLSSHIIAGDKYDFQRLRDSESTVNFLQYTGLKDKNGNEIYEGDFIVDFPNHDKNPPAEVKFHIENIGSCGCCYGAFSGSGFAAFSESYKFDSVSITGDCEVIGNIYENPELLQQNN